MNELTFTRRRRRRSTRVRFNQIRRWGVHYGLTVEQYSTDPDTVALIYANIRMKQRKY